VHLVQILLPLYTRGGARQPAARFDLLEKELTDAFGGVTTYVRAPAHGRWRNEDGDIEHDEVIVCEAMVTDLDRAWWSRYRETLTARFEQEDVVVRATAIETL